MVQHQFTLGCDPGLHGAIALLDGKSLVDVWDIPSTPKLSGKGLEVSPQLMSHVISEIMQYPAGYEACCVHAVVEVVHAMPGNGGSSMFSFGRSYGVLLGVLAGLGISTTYVRPTEWKKQFGLSKKVKDASRTYVLSRYPDRADLFKRKKDCDRADAVLIGLHWVGGACD